MTLKNKRVLITCGATWVPIDEMRVISNRSSGELGRILALTLRRAGAKVTVLAGPGAPTFPPTVKVFGYRFYDDLAALLHKALRRKYDVVIHAAAVSDYRLKKPFTGKLRSGQRQVRLALVPTEKLIDRIKRLAPGSFLVGFKLEPSLSATAGKGPEALFTKAKCDLVVVNSLRGGYRAAITDRQGRVLARAGSRRTLAEQLLKIIKQNL